MVCELIIVTSPVQPTVEIVSGTVGFVKVDGSQFATCTDAAGVVGTRVTIEYTIRVSNAKAGFKLKYEYTVDGVLKNWVDTLSTTQGIGELGYVVSFADTYVVGTYTALKVSISDIVAA